MKYPAVFIYFLTFLLTLISSVQFIQRTGFSLAKMHYVVEEVFPNSAATEAGLEPGDKITGINSQSISSDLDLVMQTERSVGGEIALSIERNRHKLNKQVPVPTNPAENQGRLGIIYQIYGFSWPGLFYLVKELLFGGGFLITGMLILRNHGRAVIGLALALLGYTLFTSIIANYWAGILYYSIVLAFTLIWLFCNRAMLTQSNHRNKV